MTNINVTDLSEALKVIALDSNNGDDKIEVAQQISIKLEASEPSFSTSFSSCEPSAKIKSENDPLSIPSTSKDTPPSFSSRKKSRKRRKTVCKVSGALFDQNGVHLVTGIDSCDCMNSRCPGCYLSCPKCNSTKCGPECRCNRKFMYDEFASEASEPSSSTSFSPCEPSSKIKSENDPLSIPSTSKDTPPSFSSRKRSRKRRKTVFTVSGALYDQNGVHLATGIDSCDCMDLRCPGCYFPCPKCNSAKCGPKCRCNRKFMYDEIASESFPFGSVVTKNPLLK